MKITCYFYIKCVNYFNINMLYENKGMCSYKPCFILNILNLGTWVPSIPGLNFGHLVVGPGAFYQLAL